MEWYYYVIGIFAFLLILGIIVLIHEGGHFLLAKKAGILCHEFSIGMGPVLFQKKIGETVYSIRAIPIGGFVSMAGEEVNFDALKDVKKVKLEFDENKRIKGIIADVDNPKYDGMPLYTIVSYDIIGTKEEAEGELFMEVSLDDTTERFEVLKDAMMYFPKKQMAQIAPYNRNFANKTLLQRFLSVFAGPAMNFVLAFLLFFVLGALKGYAKEDSTILSKVDDKAPIYVATEKLEDKHIEEEDKIISINGIELKEWKNITDILDSFAMNGEYKVDENTIIPYNGYLEVVYLDHDHQDKDITVTVVPNTYIYSIQLVFDNPQTIEGDVHQQPIVGEFNKNNKKTLAYKAGLLKGDKIIGIASVDKKKFEFNAKKKIENNVEDLEYTKVETINDVVNYFRGIEETKFIVIQYERVNEETGETETKYTKPMESYSKPYLEAAGINGIELELGVSPIYERNFLKLLYMPFVDVFGCVVDIFKSLSLLFNPAANVGVDDFSSVIGIYELITTASAEGIYSLLYIFAFLSANIGFVNLLPLPALDGGRLAFLLFEAITKKKPNPKVENIIHTIGLIALMALMGFIVLNELLRLVGLK